MYLCMHSMAYIRFNFTNAEIEKVTEMGQCKQRARLRIHRRRRFGRWSFATLFRRLDKTAHCSDALLLLPWHASTLQARGVLTHAPHELSKISSPVGLQPMQLATRGRLLRGAARSALLQFSFEQRDVRGQQQAHGNSRARHPEHNLISSFAPSKCNSAR